MKNRFNLGSRVKVERYNDNDCYDSFRGETLEVVHIATSRRDHQGYDDGMEGMALYDLKNVKTGECIGCSLYEYELEKA